MIFREDGIWVTPGERDHILSQTGVFCLEQGERKLFEATLPSKWTLSPLFTDDDIHTGDNPLFEGQRDPADYLQSLAKGELTEAGIDPDELKHTELEPDTLPPDTTDRHCLPIEVAPNLACLYAMVATMKAEIEEDPEIQEIAAQNARSLLAIMPMPLRDQVTADNAAIFHYVI